MGNPIREIIDAQERHRSNGVEPERLDLDPNFAEKLFSDEKINRIEIDEHRDHLATVNSINIYSDSGLEGVPEKGRMIGTNGSVVTITEDGEIRD